MNKNNIIIGIILVLFICIASLGCRHNHEFVDGKCECGELHNCIYVDGKCECGKIEEKHEHSFINGSCECGELHNCTYVDCKCECGNVEPHTHEFVNGECSCGEKHDCEYVDGKCECGAFLILKDVTSINEHLDINGFVSYEYSRVITFSEVVLLEETTHATQNGETYDVHKVIEKLNEEGEYITEETDSSEPKESFKIDLQLLEEYFETVTVDNNILEGLVIDGYSDAVLGYLAENINVKVELTQNLKVSYILITYVDVETGFNVTLSIKYNY